MSIINSQELSLLRKRPHYTKLWLSVYQPKTRWASMTSGSALTIGSTAIGYDTVITGSYANVNSGMTVYVGSTVGGKDKGRIHVKSITSGVLTVPSNSHIEWANNLYLTAVDFYEIWPVFPAMVRSGENVIFYKDTDISYSNQNKVYGSLINMGSHYAGFIENSTGTVYYTATGTIQVGGYDQSYSWLFEGGNPTGSTAHTPGYVNYTTPGHYTTSLTVTSSGTSTSYRHVSIYDRPGNGTNIPTTKWELGNFEGSRDEGGYNIEITMYQDTSSVCDGALIVLFADDIYETTTQSIGGEQENRQKIVFVGYIKDGSIVYDYQTSSVTFEAVSATSIMKSREGPSVSIDSIQTTPTTWFQMLDMDVKRAIYHYYKWHTTLLNTTDIKILSQADTKIQYFETDPASMYDALNTLFTERMFLPIISDKQGIIYLETSPEVINQATGTMIMGMELLRQDWINEPEITEILVPPIAYLEMGGLGYSGSTGTTGNFIASAPGQYAGYIGERIDGQYSLIVGSQAQLNNMTGDFFAYQNAKYPDVTMQLSGNYRNIDIVPLNQYLITLNASDTHRGITWTRRPFHVVDVGWEYNSQDNTLLPEVILHEITSGYAGYTVDIPQTPVDNYPTQPPYTPPDWDIIPIPGFVPIGPPPIIITPPPEIDDLCRTDLNYPANGPFDLSLSYNDLTCVDEWPVVGYIDARLRDPLAANVTHYEVTGLWEKRVVTTDPIGAWAATNEDTWWEIYALSEAGAIIGTGVHDAVTGDGTVRTGTFNHIAAQNIKGFQIVLFGDATTLTSSSDSVFNPYGYNSSYQHYWHYEGKTLVIEQLYSQSGIGGGGWPGLWHTVSFETTDTGIAIISARWVNMDVVYVFSGTRFRDAKYEAVLPTYGETFVAPISGSKSFIIPPFYLASSLGSVLANTNLLSCAGIGFGLFGTLTWRITPMACHRLHLDSVKIYNLCGSGPIGT
jgi:hypothetical protein